MIRTWGLIRPEVLRMCVVCSISLAVRGSRGWRRSSCCTLGLSVGIAMCFFSLSMEGPNRSGRRAVRAAYCYRRCSGLCFFGLFGKELGAVVQHLGSAYVQDDDDDDPQHEPDAINRTNQVKRRGGQGHELEVDDHTQQDEGE